LAEGGVPPFHLRGLPSFLPTTGRSFSQEQVLRGVPPITEGVAGFGPIRNGLPEPKAGRAGFGLQ